MKKRTKILVGAAAVIVVVTLTGAAKYVSVIRSASSVSVIGGADGPTSIFLAGKLTEEEKGYSSITMEEAEQLFSVDGDYLILDVRQPDEFAAGHIPGAVNIPNEEIGGTEPEELPDKEQLIFVYCRSGNRSRQASEKLADMGYANIVEFGGILDWNGEIVK